MEDTIDTLISQYHQIRENLNLLVSSDLENDNLEIAEADRELVANFNAIISANARTRLQFETRMRFITERINELGDGSTIVVELTNTILNDFSKLMGKDRAHNTMTKQNIYPFKDIGGEIAQYNTIKNDLVSPNTGETAARSRSYYLEQAINSISDAFILYDRSGNLIFCNDHHLDFYPHLTDLYRSGATRQEVWRHHAVIMRETDPTMVVERYVAERQRHSSKLRADFERQLIDGRWVSTRERFLADGSTVTIRTDITRQKQSKVGQTKHGE